MDRSRRKLRSRKAAREERPENEGDNGENPRPPGPSEQAQMAASKEGNSGCVCRECAFVAKTPTALKIHCRRKHNGATGVAENVVETKSSTDQPESPTPPTGELRTDLAPIEQLSSGVTTIDSIGSTAPPIDQLSCSVASIDKISSTAPPIDQLSSGVTTVDPLSSAAPLTDHQSSGVVFIDPLSSTAPPTGHLISAVTTLDPLSSTAPPTGHLISAVTTLDPLSSTAPPTGHLISAVTTLDPLSSTAPPTGHLISAVTTLDPLSSTAPPTGHLISAVTTLDPLSSTAPPIEHGVATIDQINSAAPPSDQLGTDSCPIEQLSAETPSVEQLGCGIPGIPAIEQLSGTQRFERLYCRCCSFYTCTVEEMNAHLGDESHRNLTAEKNIGPLFEQCVEKVLVILSDEQKRGGAPSGREEGEGVAEDAGETESTDAGTSHKRKRGRPKSSQVISCSHCGLVASNPTNLSVHIRRKHSRLYGFHCKLCDYSCVTKGDMDRHCETKKHIKRVQSDADGREAVVTLDPEQTPVRSGETPPDAPSAEPQDTKNVKQEGEAEETGSDPPAKKAKYDSVYSCDHCYFVAHSALSLALHVRRKHTRDFEFVCLACSYYAVTRREMARHTATEKHKFKRQRYLHKPAADKPGDEASRPAEAETPSDDENARRNPDASHTDLEPERASGVGDGENAEGKGRGGGEEPDPQRKSGDDTNGSKDSEFADPCNAGEAEEEYNNDDDEDEEQVDEEDPGETDGESPGGEGTVCRATAFDECVFSLRRAGERSRDKADGDSYMSLQHAANMLKTLERQEVSTRVRCGDCGFLAEGLSGLNVHIMMKHPSKEKHFHCLLCGKSFHSDSSLQQHLSSSAHVRTERGCVDERPDGGAAFRCVRCNEPCSSEQELFVHIKEKHEELLREVNKYVMEDTEQINREREENPGNICKYCGKACKSSNSMAFLAHVRTHTGSKPFMCKICNFATAQLGDARNHVKRHLGMREYKCHLCGWAFVMKKHLNTHLLGKHGLGQPKERKYDCELCERSFSEKWALNNHMKLHTGDKPFKCPWPSCHYAFLTHSAMKDHYRTHTGEKSFLCDLCGFAGGTRHALTKHRRQHTGERPFRCDLCSFASTTQSHLTRHKRVHTGEKPYRCPWCDYRSNCAENIRKHILHTGKHEGVMMYNCPRCDFCTNSPSEFRNHLKVKHSDIENPDLAYLHAGIVSKSFECRLKGQGSTYVETDAPFTPDEGRLGAETLQQVIIIQGYGEEAELQSTEMEEAGLEESAAATLQTLAMSSVNGELLQVTQDGCFIPYAHKNYVLVESSAAGVEQTLQRAEKAPHEANPDGTAPSTALDALLCAVSEVDQQGGATQPDIGAAPEQVHAQGEGQEAVQVYREVVQVLGHAHEEVLQFAASQLMMREGLTQVIVNDEGTHYIVTEVADGDVYAQSEGAESGQEVALVDDPGTQPAEARVAYEPVIVKEDAQE